MSKMAINPADIVLSHKGNIKINGIELAELSKIEIKASPEKKTIGIMNSATKGEITTSYTGTIDFELSKVYSRFKPTLLECAKKLEPFNFSLECTTYNPKGNGEEDLTIENCWMNGDILLAQLNAEGDFLKETYQAGFEIESAYFDDMLDDGETWNSL